MPTGDCGRHPISEPVAGAHDRTGVVDVIKRTVIDKSHSLGNIERVRITVVLVPPRVGRIFADGDEIEG
jgi:hypothetical protein